jgi:D-xylose transport system permease protein
MVPNTLYADNFKAIGQNYLPSFGAAVPAEAWHDSSVVFAIVCMGLLLFSQWRQRRRRLKQSLTVLPLAIECLKSTGIIVGLGAFFAIMARYLGIPYSIILVLFVAWILSLVMNDTVMGRHLYAIGGNAEAARFSGINTKQRILMSYVIMGLLVGLAGLVSTARLGAATTSAGQNAELDAIASAVIGGTSLMGGQGTIWGAIVGALVMSSLDNGMSLMNMDITYQYLIKGIILLAAVWIDIAGRKVA